MKKEKLPYLFIAVALLLLFFTHRAMLPAIYYTVLATGLAIYFFSIKMILELVGNKGGKTMVVAILSNVLYGGMWYLSALCLYVPGGFLPTAFSVIALANAVTGLVYFFFDVNNEKAILHFLINLCDL